jgi:hypothetical protein
MRLPLLMPAPSKLERAGDPEVACVEADDLVAGVKDAPVARPRTPQRDRFDVTSWCYTITGQRHGLPVTFINSPRLDSPRPERRTAIKHVAFPPMRFAPVTAHLAETIDCQRNGSPGLVPRQAAIGKPVRNGSRPRVRGGNVVRVDTNREVIRSGNVDVCGRHY